MTRATHDTFMDTVIRPFDLDQHITVQKPSLEIWTGLRFRGVAPHMRDQAAFLTLGGGAGGRPLGSIFLVVISVICEQRKQFAASVLCPLVDPINKQERQM